MDAIQKRITAIVPAYNEAGSIAETVRSLKAQTLAFAEIIVVDDCSTDGTGEVAESAGARVLRPARNTRSKAGAQNHALSFITTEFCIAIDADTMLAPDAVERIVTAMEDPGVSAACGFVLPRHVSSIWERGRYIEYLFAFSYYKPVQDLFGKPMISSGCFSIYRTAILKKMGGWSTRTMAEDMDLTWTLLAEGHGVRFVPEAVCFPIEPHDWNFLGKQLRRWSHGFIQNVRLHWKSLARVPYLGSFVSIGLWDATISSLTYLLLIPLACVFLHPVFAVGYIIDMPLIAVPVMVTAVQRGEVGRALLSLPCFALIRLVNAAYMLRAIWSELIMDRPLLVYEKGH
jgi:biofilm PGA synthesis N-glycosyltransferase PgaC